MPRIFLVWLVLASCIGWAVYQMKYEVARLETNLARVNRQILNDQEAIQVLKAEWSYLNQPLQLQMFAAKYLELEPVLIKQMAEANSVPQRRQPALGAPTTALASARLPAAGATPARPAPPVAKQPPPPLDLDDEATSTPDDLPDAPETTANPALLLVKGVPQ